VLFYALSFVVIVVLLCLILLFDVFLFSSRRRHTRYWRDWSSDVCYSEQRRTDELKNIVIYRAEQLYPFPIDEIQESLKKYPKLKQLVWCQEEPMNQGAWYQIRHRFFDVLSKKLDLKYAGRDMSASPAVGQFSLHVEQQQKLIHEALY